MTKRIHLIQRINWIKRGLKSSLSESQVNDIVKAGINLNHHLIAGIYDTSKEQPYSPHEHR